MLKIFELYNKYNKQLKKILLRIKKIVLLSLTFI